MITYSYDFSGNLVKSKPGSTTPPLIASQPVNATKPLGSNATFSVVVVNSAGVTFQWKFNDGNIAGAMSDSLLITDITNADIGDYSVVIANSIGTVTSDTATLSLDTDADELPDTWERARFDNITSQRGSDDPDKDAVSNLDEYRDKTNPNNAASFNPRLIAYSNTGGAVEITPMKLQYKTGDSIKLTAKAFAPYAFIGWKGDLTGGTNPAMLTMDNNKTIQAVFAAAADMPPGMIAFWRGASNAKDLIGGHHGTFYSRDTIISPRLANGKVGKAFAFDGTVHIRVPDSSLLKPLKMTAETWVFPTAFNGDAQTILAKGYTGGVNDTWYLGIKNGIPRFFSHGDKPMDGPFAIRLNEWTHLAISFDGSYKRLYVNGVEVTFTAESGILAYEASPLTIGSDWENGVAAGFFTGRIDEVSLYNRALSANEIFEIVAADYLGKNITEPYFTTPSVLPDATTGAGYNKQLKTILGTDPVSYSIADGMLPPGMNLSSAGKITGTSNLKGTFDFTVLALDSAGASTEQLFVLQVA